MHDWETQAAQRLRWPHPREHQQLRRGNGPRGQDYLLRLDDKALAPALHVHAGGPLPRKEEPPRQTMGFEGQVEPMAGGVEIGQRRAHADRVGVIRRDWAYPYRLGVVRVRFGGEI